MINPIIDINLLPIVPGRGLVTETSTALRLAYLNKLKINTSHLNRSGFDLLDIRKNIESYIGSVEIPVGLVGPLLYNENGLQEFVYCPAGTIEGALIASMNRGAKAISLSGGFTSHIKWQRMTRTPMFLFEKHEEASCFSQFIDLNFDAIKKTAEEYSNHATLLFIKTIQLQCCVHLKFVYSTGDAAGQNMTTTCTWHAMLFIADTFKRHNDITPLDFVIEGNGSSDKKVSKENVLNGRGINISAECVVPETVIQSVLRCTSEQFLQNYKASIVLADADEMFSYNINVANAVAAIFVATGQDLGSIHESAAGILSLDRHPDGLKFSLNLPNLVIGTVGGGTQLNGQSKNLEMINCAGEGKVKRFASLIAGFALGLEISTFAAIISGEFAKAHEKLGRNKPIHWLLKSELNRKSIEPSLNGYFEDKNISEIRLLEKNVIENGIITNVASKINKKLIGFVPIKVSYENNSGDTQEKTLLIKSKALDEDVIKGLHVIAASIDPGLSDLLKQHKENLEYKNCHIKEIELYRHLHDIGFEHIPKYYGKYENPGREIFYFIQEYVDYNSLKIYNSENQPELWTKVHICNAIHVISQFHQMDMEVKCKIVRPFEPWYSKDLYKKLISIMIQDKVDIQFQGELREMLLQIDHFESEAANIQLDRCVIHNDFNPRNTFVQKDGKLLIYDWELAVIDFPHRDIVEFLSFVLPENFEEEELMDYLHFHFSLYEDVSWNEWLKAYRYSIKVYIASRVSFYEVSSILIKYDFSKRILDRSFRILKILSKHA